MLLLEFDTDAASELSYNDTLNPKIFDSAGTMHPKVHESLMRIANNFISDIDVPDMEIHDIVVTGSSANYNWTKHSDIDLHIITDVDVLQDPEMAAKYFKAAKNVWNNRHNVEIHGVDVEVYVEDNDETHRSLGRFSVLNNEWNSKPEHNTPVFDKSAVNRKARFLAAEIDNLLSGEDYDMAVYTRLKRKIWDNRQDGLIAGGEFNVDNLAFKALRNMGYLDKLLGAEQDAEDRELSVTESTEINEDFFGAAGWWLLTNPLVVAKILLVLAALWQVATVAASTFAMYKTLKWVLRKVGIMEEPEVVVEKAKNDKSYLNVVSTKIARYFKKNKGNDKIGNEVKAGMKQAMAAKNKMGVNEMRIKEVGNDTGHPDISDIERDRIW